jgi:hypothetical protein
LSIYMVVIYLGLGLAQFELNLADPRGFELFILIAVLISLAAVPMALSAQRAPDFALPHRVSFRELAVVSPLGVLGVLCSGAVSGTLFSLGSVYAIHSGFDNAGIAAFMACILPAVVAAAGRPLVGPDGSAHGARCDVVACRGRGVGCARAVLVAGLGSIRRRGRRVRRDVADDVRAVRRAHQRSPASSRWLPRAAP